mgnify:CR=1 FL=1
MTIKILTIEDDERIRTAVRFALEDEGWTVLEAETGEQALGSFNSMTPDLVLVDIGLPGMDGFEVCRALRRGSAAVARAPVYGDVGRKSHRGQAPRTGARAC